MSAPASPDWSRVVWLEGTAHTVLHAFAPAETDPRPYPTSRCGLAVVGLPELNRGDGRRCRQCTKALDGDQS